MAILLAPLHVVPRVGGVTNPGAPQPMPTLVFKGPFNSGGGGGGGGGPVGSPIDSG